ncbi:MAG: Cna B-type domain-containing protein, partial [Aristaeellaceae bacterium]
MKYSLRKLTALLIAVLMLLSAFSSALADTEYYSNQQEIGVSPLGSSKTSVDHIDIGCKNIPVYINGEKVDDMSFTKNDVKNGIVKVQIVAEGATATWSKDNVTTSTDSNRNPQVRFKGNFPVITQGKPVEYTITITKNVVYQRASIPVVFTASLTYWSSANVCNGLQGEKENKEWQNGEVVDGSGIDIAFGSGQGQVGSISFEKTVSGLELTENKEYKFKVTNTSTNAVFYETCEVSATTNYGRKTVGMIPFGTYQIEEVDAEVDGYDRVTTYQPTTQQVTLSPSNPNANISVTNRYTPSTTRVSVKKEWNDGNNQDGKRPNEVTVRLKANGEIVEGKTLTLKASEGWTGSFTGLDVKDANGTPITYAVEEATVADYSSSVAKNEDGSFTITNTET